jgi:hypothetical protein
MLLSPRRMKAKLSSLNPTRSNKNGCNANADTRTFEAGENLSAAQFKFVTLESDGQVDLADSAGENCIGVLLNAPDAAGKAATVAISVRL